MKGLNFTTEQWQYNSHFMIPTDFTIMKSSSNLLRPYDFYETYHPIQNH